MKTYTYRAVCYVDVIASNEEEAINLAQDLLPVKPDEIDLYEIEEEEQDWDAINDDRRLGIGRFSDE